jgi:MFS transporter, OFA family, oxalate/formate antiporter
MNFEQGRWKCMVAAMVLAVFAGIGYTWSVFQTPLMESFGWSLKVISLTFTIQILTSTVAPVFLGKYQKTLGIGNYLRIGIVIYVLGLTATMFTNSIGYLYIVYGIIVGTGIAMLYPCLMAYSGRLFPDKTGMAAGLLACAYGSGALFWAPIASSLMQKFGVLKVFGILAVLFAVVMIPVSFFIKTVPEDFRPQPAKSKKSNTNTASTVDYTWKEMLKSHKYYILVIALTLGATSGLMITGHASSMLQEVLSFSAKQAAVFVGLISVFNALGRLTSGAVSDYFGRYNVMLFLFAVVGGAMVLLTQSTGIIFVIALLAIISCYGGFTSMFSPVCADNFGLKNLAVNYSFLYVAYGLAGVIGPQVAAATKTASGGYNLAFMMVAVMSVVGFLLILFLKTEKKR